MSLVDDHQTGVHQQALPMQRQPSSPIAPPSLAAQLAEAVRERDEARSFARDLWITAPLDARFVVQDLRGGLPSWIPRR